MRVQEFCFGMWEAMNLNQHEKDFMRVQEFCFSMWEVMNLNQLDKEGVNFEAA